MLDAATGGREEDSSEDALAGRPPPDAPVRQDDGFPNDERDAPPWRSARRTPPPGQVAALGRTPRSPVGTRSARGQGAASPRLQDAVVDQATNDGRDMRQQGCSVGSASYPPRRVAWANIMRCV